MDPATHSPTYRLPLAEIRSFMHTLRTLLATPCRTPSQKESLHHAAAALLQPLLPSPAGPITTSLDITPKLRRRDYIHHLYVQPPTQISPLPTYSFVPHHFHPSSQPPDAPIAPDHQPHWDAYHQNWWHAPTATSLGHPFPTEAAIQLVYQQPPPPPLPILTPHHSPIQDLIYDPQLPHTFIFTPKGWRPTAGCLSVALPEFQRTHAHPEIVRTLQNGHHPRWQALPDPLYFHNHPTVHLHPDIVQQEITTLRLLDILTPYDSATIKLHGPPITVLPLSLKEEGPKKWRLLVDPRYPNATATHTTVFYERLSDFTCLINTTTLLAKTDMVGGFHQLLLSPAMIPYAVIEWHGTLYYFRTCFLAKHPPHASFNT